MAFFNPYIVFILKVEEDYVTGLTSDIDSVIQDLQTQKEKVNLVFQQHFDDIDQAKTFEAKINRWDKAKKEALIRGDE